MSGNDYDPFGIADDDVARIDGDARAADRLVDGNRAQAQKARRRRRAHVVGGKRELRYLRRIAESSVGDDAGHAARLEPPDQEIAAAAGLGLALRVDHHDCARRALLEGLLMKLAGLDVLA